MRSRKTHRGKAATKELHKPERAVFLATEGTEDTEIFNQNCMNPKELRDHRVEKKKLRGEEVKR